MWHWDGHMGWGWMGFWWLIILLVVGAVVWFVLSAARRGGDRPQDTPEQALKRRYAKGEIDREAYERMMEDLRK